MMRKIVCGWLLLFVATRVGAAEIAPSQPVGLVRLESLSGHTIEMNNYGERPATVVLFLSSRCPVTERLMADINALNQKYRLRDVLVVGVSSSAAESGDELREFAQRRGAAFPIYRDPDGAVSRTFSAKATPELFVLDRGGKLVFHGGLQDAAARAAYEAAID